jgi:toxin ParE1/3/4
MSDLQRATNPLARKDLKDIWRYSSRRWGKPQADFYLRRINDAISMLCTYPELGTAIDEVRPGYRKFDVGSHMVIYRFDDNALHVTRVLHQAMDLDRHI